MKKIACICYSVLVIGSLSAQTVLRSDTLFIPFRLEVENDVFAPRLLTDKLVYKSKYIPLFAIKDLQLTDADLQLQFERIELDEEIRYRDKIAIRSSKGQLMPLDFDRPSVENNARRSWESKRIDFLDATESNLILGEEYTIALTADFLSSQLDCEEKPSFGLDKMWPHYAGAVVGLSLIGIGQSYKSQSDATYAQYRRQWEDGAPFSLAGSYLTNADDDYQRYRGFTITGLAVLGIDAAWLLIFRWPKHLKSVRLFKKYCSENQAVSLRVRPGLSRTNRQDQMNFLLTLNF